MGLKQRILEYHEKKRVTYHLLGAKYNLIANSVKKHKTGSKRLLQINKLDTYIHNEEYPINTDFPGKRMPYIRDDAGTLCALGYMVYETGGQELVNSLNQEDNNVFVKDVHDGPLIRWLDENEIDKDEAIRIQPAYEPVNRIIDISSTSRIVMTLGHTFILLLFSTLWLFKLRLSKLPMDRKLSNRSSVILLTAIGVYMSVTIRTLVLEYVNAFGPFYIDLQLSHVIIYIAISIIALVIIWLLLGIKQKFNIAKTFALRAASIGYAYGMYDLIINNQVNWYWNGSIELTGFTFLDFFIPILIVFITFFFQFGIATEN